MTKNQFSISLYPEEVERLKNAAETRRQSAGKLGAELVVKGLDELEKDKEPGSDSQ